MSLADANDSEADTTEYKETSGIFNLLSEVAEEHEEVKITPLHLAFFEGNNRSINIKICLVCGIAQY